MRCTGPTFVLVTCLFLLQSGCDVPYLAHLVSGEWASLSNTLPIDQALSDANLTEDERAKLALTQDVRRFGIEQIGMFAGDAYTLFEANGSAPAAYILTASLKESLTPHQWLLPIVGWSETKLFFDQEMGRREADALAEAGLDVFFARAEGFSTLGILPDPVRQSNLMMDEIDLAELILHEITHSTVVKPWDANFNESVATFVGRAAAQAWFDATFGADSAEAAAARLRYADKAVADEYVNDVFDRMTTYYTEAAARGEPREAIIAGRQAEFDAARSRYTTVFQPRLMDPDHWGFVGDVALDNARLLVGIRYQGTLSDYQGVLDRASGDLPEALKVYIEAAGRPDSRDFLRSWAPPAP